MAPEVVSQVKSYVNRLTGFSCSLYMLYAGKHPVYGGDRLFDFFFFQVECDLFRGPAHILFFPKKTRLLSNKVFDYLRLKLRQNESQ